LTIPIFEGRHCSRQLRALERSWSGIRAGTKWVGGDEARKHFKAEKIHLKLEGTKLKGEWTLGENAFEARIREKAQWLILEKAVIRALGRFPSQD